jgi:hypothetical protein
VEMRRQRIDVPESHSGETMTTLCHIVLTVVTCTIDPATPKPTPAEAVAIFAASAGPWRVGASAPDGWQWDSDAPLVEYDPGWPFKGAFAPTWAPTTRRLDGTSLFDPPMIYGAPPFSHHGYGYGYGAGRFGDRARGQSSRVSRERPVRTGDGQRSGGAERRVAGPPRATGESVPPAPHAGGNGMPLRRR